MELLPRPRTEKPLASYRGWLLVFVLLHFPLALLYFTTGIYAIAGYLQVGGGWALALLNLLLCLLLPAALLLLLWKKPAFRWVYVAYSAVMIANFLVQQYDANGCITFLNILVASALTVPWILYIFLSKRVAAVLASGRKRSDPREDGGSAGDNVEE